ncbi:hypothetical protein BBW65_03410 [Helicobacter enhydrae]|uniref:Disulfide isomerase DsbG N-terminal domain-containing protein n=1 Tax=Helicobacter enhydrae TaxID=222136 RepID=A0A1B1U558_9HELI|nr:hypothetical protein [Helicobacter enhydrae]ANV97903.1 hypothetical protein BBW65_03410 [Helicobacter enhydrae]
MKKIWCLIALFVFASGADLKTQIAKLIKDKTNTQLEVSKVYDLAGSKDLKIVMLESKADKEKMLVLATADGAVIVGLSNVFISENPKDLALLSELYQQTMPPAKKPDPKVLDKFFSTLKSSRYITLTSDSKNKTQTTYIVSDPRCPSCRKELGEVEERLKTGDVKILLVSFLGNESAIKASLIYEKLIGVKNTQEKIKIMKEIYDPNFKPSKRESMISTKQVEKNTADVTGVGIESVPLVHTIKR